MTKAIGKARSKADPRKRIHTQDELAQELKDQGSRPRR